MLERTPNDKELKKQYMQSYLYMLMQLPKTNFFLSPKKSNDAMNSISNSLCMNPNISFRRKKAKQKRQKRC